MTARSLGVAVTSLTADPEIDGAGSVFGMDQLGGNRGRTTLTSAADLSISPAGTFVHEGIMDLSPGPVQLVDTSRPVRRIESTSANNCGMSIVIRQISLNSATSTSRLVPHQVGGHDPALGARHDVIVTGATFIDGFDNFQCGATPSGNGLLATRPNRYTSAVDVGPGPLPQIVGQTFDDEARDGDRHIWCRGVGPAPVGWLGRRPRGRDRLTWTTSVVGPGARASCARPARRFGLPKLTAAGPEWGRPGTPTRSAHRRTPLADCLFCGALFSP